MRTSQLPIDACASGQVQVVLPFAIALAHGLDICATAPLPSAQLYLSRRRPLAASTVDAFVGEIQRRATSVLSEPSPRALA